MARKSISTTLVRGLCQIILTISLIVVSCFLPFLLIPFALYRVFVFICAKLFGPENVTHFLPATNAIFALEESTKKPKANLVGYFILQGDLDADRIRRDMEERVLYKKRKNGEFMYPELRQFATEFMGYFFWKYEDNFSLSDHVRTYDYEDEECKIPKDCCTEKDLERVMGGLLSKPWKEGFSQWEILHIPNYQCNPSSYGNERQPEGTQASVMCFRLHHSMGDGYGWLNLLVVDLAQADLKDVDVPNISRPKRSIITTIASILILPFKLPWDIAADTLESYDPVNAWRTPDKRSRKLYASISRPFPVQLIKDLKTKFGVSYMAVLSSVAAGAVRRAMQEAGQNVPEKMAVLNPIPIPGHPDNLDIYATMLHVTWPISETDPSKRLKQIFRNFKEKAWMTSPMGYFWAARVCCVMPNFFQRSFIAQRMSSLSASNFPGPLNPPTFMGCKPLDIMVGCGLGAGKAGAFLSMVSVCGHQRFVISIEKTLYPSQQMFSKFGDYIHDELEMLKSCPADPVSVV